MNYFSNEFLEKFNEIQLNFIKTRIDNKVFYLTLNRPEKRNAFTPTMVKEIALALEFANQNDEVWCAVIEAEGTIFCAGMDLNVFQNPALDSQNEQIQKPNREISLGEVFNNFRKPSIAKVQGSVFAGGFLIICACTFVVADERAAFGLPEVKRGIFPMQVMASLMKIMTERKVLELCILGKNYSAAESLDLGIVTQISKVGELDSDVKSLINSILANSPFAIRKGIDAFQGIKNVSESERFVYLLGQLKLIQNSEDAKEGILAFKEKRKPIWQNK